MKMIELNKEKFEEFAIKNNYYNYCQTENYAEVMAKTGFEYSFVGYTTNDLEILAAGMFLIKKIGSYYYAYSPKGFIIDYSDYDLLRRFSNNLIKYFKRKNIVFLKINPEIPISEIDINSFEKINQKNQDILESFRKLGYKRRKETEPLQLLQPKLTALINLKDYDINKLDKRVRNKINSTNIKGLELEICDESKIEILYEFIKNMKDIKNTYHHMK